jgi:hypothetical protein
MGRVPEEPAFDAVGRITSVDVSNAEGQPTEPSITAVSWPNALDFNKLESQNAGKYRVLQQHMEEMAQAGLRLTDTDKTPMELVTRQTKNGMTVQAEKASVVGVSFPDLQCVRHQAEFDIDAKTVFDVYNRLNYTEAIDAYTYLVEQLEEVDCAESRFSWAHVAYTGDKIMPGFAHRDFVTFDFVDADNLMLVSRSCVHPSRPQTPDPTCLHGIVGMCSNRPSRTIRSPLCYFLRVIPLGENKCRVVQFQYSDVGGIVPPKSQTEAVVKFGLGNLERFNHLVKKAQTNKLKIGPEMEDYLANPLVPKWRQDVNVMIPGL